MLSGKKLLLIITGGIAAYKSLELVRKLKEKGAEVIPVMTKAAEIADAIGSKIFVIFI